MLRYDIVVIPKSADPYANVRNGPLEARAVFGRRCFGAGAILGLALFWVSPSFGARAIFARRCFRLTPDDRLS